MAEVFYSNANELATLTNTFSVNGTATDPTTISLTITDPAGTATTYTYAAAQITRTSAGIYTKDIACTLAGTWLYLWVGTGAASDAQAGTWTVLSATLSTRYCSLEELKSRVGEASRTDHDFELSIAVDSGSRSIDGFCGRIFYLAGTASARVFYPRDPYLAKVDDFYTITDLVIKTDEDNDGTYETTWASADYQLEPLNGVVDGESGWPFWRIRAVGTKRFPCVSANTRAPLQVTAKWGWAAVPVNVKDASLILAEEAFRLKDSPFGVGGYGQFGIIRVRDNPMAARLVARYQRDPVLVA